MRVNNRVRRAVDAALGGLPCSRPTRPRALAAAEAVFKSRDAAALPALDRAHRQETDSGGASAAMAQARAAAVLSTPDAPEADKLAADRRAARARRPRRAQRCSASLPSPPPTVMAAAGAARGRDRHALQL